MQSLVLRTTVMKETGCSRDVGSEMSRNLCYDLSLYEDSFTENHWSLFSGIHRILISFNLDLRNSMIYYDLPTMREVFETNNAQTRLKMQENCVQLVVEVRGRNT